MSNLRQRNLAVLAALTAFAALIFAITVVRIQQGIDRKAATMEQAHVEQPAQP